MSWYDHGQCWDRAWRVEHAASMWMMWSEGKNARAQAYHSSEGGDAESEIYSRKGLRWQVRR